MQARGRKSLPARGDGRCFRLKRISTFWHRSPPSLDIWETTYLQVLDGEDPVLAWVSGTGLRPFVQPLEEDRARKPFITQYGARLRDAYPRRARRKDAVSVPASVCCGKALNLDYADRAIAEIVNRARLQTASAGTPVVLHSASVSKSRSSASPSLSSLQRESCARKDDARAK